MVDIAKYLNGTHITAKELAHDTRIETIANVQEGQFEKLDLVFESKDKLSLNTTNLRTMRKHYGAETDLWVGKKVTLVVGELTFRGKSVDSVLIVPVSGDIQK